MQTLNPLSNSVLLNQEIKVGFVYSPNLLSAYNNLHLMPDRTAPIPTYYVCGVANNYCAIKVELNPSVVEMAAAANKFFSVSAKLENGTKTCSARVRIGQEVVYLDQYETSTGRYRLKFAEATVNPDAQNQEATHSGEIEVAVTLYSYSLKKQQVLKATQQVLSAAVSSTVSSTVASSVVLNNSLEPMITEKQSKNGKIRIMGECIQRKRSNNTVAPVQLSNTLQKEPCGQSTECLVEQIHTVKLLGTVKFVTVEGFAVTREIVRLALQQSNPSKEPIDLETYQPVDTHVLLRKFIQRNETLDAVIKFDFEYNPIHGYLNIPSPVPQASSTTNAETKGTNSNVLHETAALLQNLKKRKGISDAQSSTEGSTEQHSTETAKKKQKTEASQSSLTHGNSFSSATNALPQTAAFSNYTNSEDDEEIDLNRDYD